jgi:hypothetical protein
MYKIDSAQISFTTLCPTNKATTGNAYVLEASGKPSLGGLRSQCGFLLNEMEASSGMNYGRSARTWLVFSLFGQREKLLLGVAAARNTTPSLFTRLLAANNVSVCGVQ